MVFFTRSPTRSYNLALVLILGFLLESTNRDMIVIQQIVYLSTRSIPKMKVPSMANQNIRYFKIKTRVQAQETNSRMFTIKSMTLRIHLLNDYEAGTS